MAFYTDVYMNFPVVQFAMHCLYHVMHCVIFNIFSFHISF